MLTTAAVFCGIWTGLGVPVINVPGFAGEVSISLIFDSTDNHPERHAYRSEPGERATQGWPGHSSEQGDCQSL